METADIILLVFLIAAGLSLSTSENRHEKGRGRDNMYKDHWKKILEAWRNELEASLDLSNAVRIHLVAEEKGKGEIHRFVAIGASRASAELVITRMISQLADLKLADHDPTTIQIRAVTWVNRSTALDDLGHIRRAKEPLANSDIPAAPDLVQ